MLTLTSPLNRFKSLIIAVVFTTLLVSCGFRKEKNQDGNSNAELQSADQFAVRSIGYQQVKEAIFLPYCTGCHSGRIQPNLTTFGSIKQNLAAIESVTLQKKTMPKKGPLEPKLRAYLAAWIRDGAKEVAEAPVPTAATTITIERPVTFEQLKTKVLATNCNSCHSVGNAEGMTELETYKSVMSVQEWLRPLIEGTVNGEAIPEEQRMPPASSLPLTKEQKDLVNFWYEDGLKE